MPFLKVLTSSLPKTACYLTHLTMLEEYIHHEKVAVFCHDKYAKKQLPLAIQIVTHTSVNFVNGAIHLTS